MIRAGKNVRAGDSRPRWWWDRQASTAAVMVTDAHRLLMDLGDDLDFDDCAGLRRVMEVGERVTALCYRHVLENSG
jgi:hypothetical protein